MSVKFERDTIRQTTQAAHNILPKNGPLPGTSGKHPLAETIGTALTGGAGNAGVKGYLAVRTPSLIPCRVSLNGMEFGGDRWKRGARGER